MTKAERIDYIITVRSEVHIEYTIKAESKEEAWQKFYSNDYYSKEYIQNINEEHARLKATISES